MNDEVDDDHAQEESGDCDDHVMTPCADLYAWGTLGWLVGGAPQSAPQALPPWRGESILPLLLCLHTHPLIDQARICIRISCYMAAYLVPYGCLHI